jgi:hypothetical protein
MPEHPSERDWKRWQQLAPVLLNRFCGFVVASAANFSTEGGSGHERFLALYEFMVESNRKIAAVFDDRRRSNAIFQIAAAVSSGIMSSEELSSFSEEMQQRVQALVAIGVASQNDSSPTYPCGGHGS